MVALALEQTHFQGLAHGKINSAHVYLSRDKKTVKLGSFACRSYVQHLVQENENIDDGYYASPEGSHCSRESDLWALGMLLLELVRVGKYEGMVEVPEHFCQAIREILEGLL